jgi:hypothetical protein
VPTRIGRDHDTVVGDVQEAVGGFDRDRFAGEMKSSRTSRGDGILPVVVGE